MATPVKVLQSRTKMPIVNNFSIKIATKNGTGSTTANSTILRALFKMGIPVHGKNIFPSNIQGLATWYHIRVARELSIAMARATQTNLLIAFNPDTFTEDVNELLANDLLTKAVCFYNSDWQGKMALNLPETPEGVVYYPLPVNDFVKKSGVETKKRSLVANMVYVGALAQVIAIPLELIENALIYNLKGKPKEAVELNFKVIKEAFVWCEQNLAKLNYYKVEQMTKTEGQVLLSGNEAAALGAIYGGVTLASWYPITPSTSLIEALEKYLPTFRPADKSGKKSYAIVQAEDEIAAVGMVIGAGWAGARAMTATSGPGISLMAEFAGLSYFAEIPAVIWDVQRVGPSTGLPTRTGQGDITFAYNLGHGDTKHVLLFPSDIEECFEFAISAFDLADQLQTLVLVMSDLDLGMNYWMSPALKAPNNKFNLGRVLTAEEITARGNKFVRYQDEKGDGISYRTLPGNSHPNSAYFTRGTGHDENAKYSEKPEDWQKNMERLKRKFDTARQQVPKSIIAEQGSKIGIISFGSTKFAINEAREKLSQENITTDFMRLRALPINGEVKEFVDNHELVYVVELNRDGQMHNILQNEIPELATKLISLAHLDGLPLSADWVVKKVKEHQTSLKNQWSDKPILAASA